MSQKKEDACETVQGSDGLPWDDSDFARISQSVTRATPPEATTEAAPSPSIPEPLNDHASATAAEEEPAAGADTTWMESTQIDVAPPAPIETARIEEPSESTVSSNGEEETAAGKQLDEEFPRIIKLKGLSAPTGEQAPSQISAPPVPARDETPKEMEPAGIETILPPRREPSFGVYGRSAVDEREPSLGPRDTPIIGRRGVRPSPAFDHHDDKAPWSRRPPRFDDALDTTPTRIIPEAIVPQAFAPAEDWEDENERRSPLRWVAVAATLVVGCYAAVNTLQPERFFAPRQMEIAQNEVPQPSPTPTTSATPSTSSPLSPASAKKPTTTSTANVDAKTTRLAKAAPLKKPAPETAARANKTVAAAPSKPVASQTAAHHRNEPDEAEIEAMAERQSGPVVLAPGPRMLDASPAIPASLPTRVSGDLIYDVQSKLMRLGYSPGPIDGTFSPQTRNAVLHFQNDMGLRPTGEIDAELLRRLRTTRQVDLRFVRGPMPLSQ